MPMQWQNFLDVLGRKMRSSRLASDIALKTKINREDELMSYLATDHEIIKLISMWLDETYSKREAKSLEKATLFKLVGNREFQSKKYALSVSTYTKSAIYAPADSEDLSVAIANRSASLFYLGKYHECIKDIELATKLKYPRNLCYKLYVRAVQCYLKLGKKEYARAALHQLRLLINDDMPNAKKEALEKQLAQLSSSVSRMVDTGDDVTDITEAHSLPEISFGENPNLPSASAAVDVKYTPQKGRHVIANRDIKKGQTLLVEKPFSFVLLECDGINDLCENCCRSYGKNPTPCSGCLNTLFCDANCWDEAYSSYHRWECAGNQMGLWQQIGVAHLGLKTLLKCTTTNDSSMFNSIQQLVTCFDNLTANDLIVYGITATMLTLYLTKYTDYFKVFNIREHLVSKFTDNTFNFNNDLASESDERVYVSSLLLRHVLQLICNGHAITKLNKIASDKDKLCVEQQDRIATAIYPSASMMNHSCDPNIITSFVDQYLIVRAMKDIAAGEEVLNCYGPNFRRMSKEHRYEILKNQYGFTCRCEPCVMPEYQNFMDRFQAIKCPECGGALEEFHSYSMHCLDCGATPVVNCQNELKNAVTAFDAAQIYIELEREEEAVVKLKECLSIRRNVLYKYHQDLTATLDILGKVYAIMGRWLESISYIEHSIAAIEERYGSSSIEVANELNKLTDICIRYLQEEPNKTTKWYKNILKKTRRYLDRADEIVSFTYGPWHEICQEINEKKKTLAVILKDYDI
ncbi:PREDICTED: SET and MYND domain-containing protein 4-like [Dinoponera quadriceps]|uniref:Protein-lysine N-methyltransferase SMYD4 n=1 Tax=Dinoponera quadriceps TaxID=609295 RepID=A0A6P3WNN3_DINQU|nr:PREDICTED: SET and MYND domain-containing protein 4-like [Dinoponera quadriceps]